MKTGRLIIVLSIFAIGLSGCSPKTSAGDDVPDMSILDRGSTTEMSAFLNEIFPVGTDKAFVEKMLVDVAGAKKSKSFNLVKLYEGHYDFQFDKNEYKESFTYRYRRAFFHRMSHLFLTDGSYTIGMSYDKKDRVISYISLSGPTGL